MTQQQTQRVAFSSEGKFISFQDRLKTTQEEKEREEKKREEMKRKERKKLLNEISQRNIEIITFWTNRKKEGIKETEEIQKNLEVLLDFERLREEVELIDELELSLA